MIDLEILREILSGVKTEHKNSLEASSVINQVWKEVLEYSEQERKKGKWIKDGEIPNTCSVCGEDWDKYVEGQDIWYTGEIPNFCPNCGCQMNGGEENG